MATWHGDFAATPPKWWWDFFRVLCCSRLSLWAFFSLDMNHFRAEHRDEVRAMQPNVVTSMASHGREVPSVWD